MELLGGFFIGLPIGIIVGGVLVLMIQKGADEIDP